MLKNSFFLILALTAQPVLSQNVKQEVVNYQYIQLPMSPVDKSISNYQSKITASYIEENNRKTAEYESEKALAQEEYDRKMAAYPAAVAAADAAFANEMKAYNEKSLAEKVVEKQLLNENTKPVKRVPPRPYLRTVAKPKLQKIYDFEALAGTYLNIDGFENSTGNAINVDVTINGFEYTKPVRKSEKKKYISNGTTSYKTYYWNEMTYRHTMSVRVTDPSGNQLMFVTPSELNNYTTYKTKSSEKTVAINEEQLVSDLEQKILQSNLEFIQNLVNDEVGYKRTDRKGSSFYVKEKKGEYTDILVAYNESTSGLKMLVDNEEAAKSEISGALVAYENALLEAEPNNKKARIGKKVTLPLYFSLIECYWAIGNMDRVDELMNELNTMPLVRRDKTKKEEYQALVADTKARLKANGL
jgi:hypothetical protein